MKKIYVFYSLITIIIIIANGCNERDYLNEVPLDFYSPENSFITESDFTSAIYNLHAKIRDELWGQSSQTKFPRIGWYGTDLVESRYDTDRSHKYNILWGPNGFVLDIWELCYRIVYDANVIIDRADEGPNELTEEAKRLIIAEARFFRGFAYNMLANLYGGVPIVLHEVKAPKRDFVRSTRNEVYEQCVNDLKYAIDNLKDIDEIDESRINKLAAKHVLTEVYISLNQWDNAIVAATGVIEHPRMGLMTERFGTNSEKLFNDPNFAGDVYWDLFRQNNQDRKNGNTESIWVLQYSYNTPGGGDKNYELERFVGPDLTKAHIYQSDGKTSPILTKPNSYYNGRGQGFCKPSPYFLTTLWEKSGYNQDIRNSNNNIIRDVQVNNPSNEYDGMWIIADNLPLKRVSNDDTTRHFYPIIGKVINPGMHPSEYWDPDQSIPGSLLGSAQHTWRKHYMIRLAETYLLRAEAYLGKGELENAALDLNVVRRRAHAPDVAEAEIDIDYILDERLRELYFETLRIITLTRLGKVVERAQKLNPIVSESIQAHQNIWAIPFNEINKNVEAELTQNPGY